MPGACLIVRDLGAETAYGDVLQAMRDFTDARAVDTPDELWLTEHTPVFTQGQAGKAEFVLDPGDIPVLQSDRGGQVTYHGPGQLVAYLLFDLRRLGLTIRGLVDGIEGAVVALLADYGLAASARADAPGVYVGDNDRDRPGGAVDKIAALGLRVRRGCSYHGLSLNVDMDLAPYSRIVPCGLFNTGVTMLAALAGPCSTAEVTPRLVAHLAQQYGFERVSYAASASAYAPRPRSEGG